MIFALAAVPVIGAAGVAIDYSRADASRTALRLHADRAAILVAAQGSKDAAHESTVLAQTKAAIEAEMGTGIGSVAVDGRWQDAVHYRVEIAAEVPTTLTGVLPYAPDTIAIDTLAVARRSPPQYETQPPTRSLLDPEAGDYNRIYMYCYDPNKSHEDQRGRSGLTPIADNGTPPTDYSNRNLPECGPGEIQSYMLRNVRGARRDRGRWDRATEEVYEYYADATIDPLTEAVRYDVRGFRVYNGQRRVGIDMAASPILETIMCRSEAECKPVREGGIIPNRRTGRTPSVTTDACAAGNFVYFGWEDRPPGLGWTDTDYDDIRLVISCPVMKEVGGREVVLVR